MIGFFDSGCGGLTVMKEVLNVLPQYDYMYLGDNARAPYGNRSHESLKKFAAQGVDYLFSQGCVLIIIACNTASAQVLRELQEEYLRAPGVKDKKILGVIRPVVEEVAKSAGECGGRGDGRTGRVGVVGTRSTINAKSYDKELHNLNPDLKVSSQACPLLVPLVEECWSKKPETKMILRKYLRPLKHDNIDTLILGCTHYPFLYDSFVQVMGKQVKVPHPGKIVAESLVKYLERHLEIETLLTKSGGSKTSGAQLKTGASTNEGARTYLTTDDPGRFQELGRRFLGMDIKEVKRVNISQA